MTESELLLEKTSLMARGAGRGHHGEASEEADAAAQVRAVGAAAVLQNYRQQRRNWDGAGGGGQERGAAV